MVSVLFVCLGNICRSPMAEAVMQHLLEKEHLEADIYVDSAGTGDWHVGCPPHEGTLTVLSEHGIKSTQHKARLLQKKDCDRFDYVICMDQSNLSNTLDIFEGVQKERVFLLMDLLPGSLYKEVPDPYYDGNFSSTFELVMEGCQALLKKIRFEHLS